MEAVKGEYYKYVQSGASLVANVGKAYRDSGPLTQQQILGSILTGNLVFDGTNFRTIPYNAAVHSYAVALKELDVIKKENPAKSRVLHNLDSMLMITQIKSKPAAIKINPW